MINNFEFIENIKGLSANSADIQKGYLFAALPGVRYDGCDFIDQAILNGATHILAPTGTKISSDVNLIESENLRHDFAIMSAKFYNLQPDNIVAITGTNGKTSTAEFIRQIFDLANLKSASLGTLGLVSKHVKGENVMTTPDPVKLHGLLADLKSSGVNYLAMEASSHGLDQSRLDGVNVQVAAFTNLSQDHLDYHENMDEYFSAKKRLFDIILPSDGAAVINIDNQYGQKINHKNIISYGRNKESDVCLLSQTPAANGQKIQVSYKGEIYNITLNLIGLFQTYNALCAAACCIALKMDVNFVFDSLSKLHGVRGRMELACQVGSNAAYVDFAHTPDALEKVLTSLRPHVKERLITVFGAGGNRDKSKRSKMGRIAESLSDIVIITDDNPRNENPEKIRNEIFSACSMAENIGDRRAAIARGVAVLKAGDVLLVAGKGHEQGQTIGEITHPFDDLIEVQKAMEALPK